MESNDEVIKPSNNASIVHGDQVTGDKFDGDKILNTLPKNTYHIFKKLDFSVFIAIVSVNLVAFCLIGNIFPFDPLKYIELFLSFIFLWFFFWVSVNYYTTMEKIRITEDGFIVHNRYYAIANIEVANIKNNKLSLINNQIENIEVAFLGFPQSNAIDNAKEFYFWLLEKKTKLKTLPS